MPSQLDSVFNAAMAFTLVAGVAAVLGKAVDGQSPAGKGQEFLPSIAPEAKRPLVEKYGLWAVNRAEAFCPHNDVECVEREAKRAYQVYRQRRGLK